MVPHRVGCPAWSFVDSVFADGGLWGGGWIGELRHLSPADGTTDRPTLPGKEARICKQSRKCTPCYGITVPIMGSKAAEREAMVSIEP
jgi:hypothetical protein